MIPDYQTIMLPLLRLISDGKIITYRESVERLSEQFNLTTEEKLELLPSGNQAIFDNRVGWAKFYLQKAGLLTSEKRGTFQITAVGKDFLDSNPTSLKTKDFEKFPLFVEFKKSVIKKSDTEQEQRTNEINEIETPEESLEYAYQKLKQDLARELLEILKNSSPAFFERVVVDLLLKMGYGGSRKDAGTSLGKSGDGGVDGIIKEDKLGLDIIYIQAKRWYKNAIPVREIRDFAGALLSKKARKGIFITTSTFPDSAFEFVRSIEHKIVLIDGQELANLMIEHNVGVTINNVYEVKKIDGDYFEES
jgi:restriction system protein